MGTMEKKGFDDKRAADLLSRVRDDISCLRDDVKHLVRHTGRHTLPEGARELVSSGRGYARQGIARAGHVARQHPAGVSLGSVLLVGAVAAGLWLLLNDGCCRSAGEPEED